MKIKVNKILKASPPYSGTSKTTGKPYTIYSYTVQGEVEGVACDLLTVKTMSEQTANAIQAGGEFQAEPQEFKGETSYMVRGDKPAYAGGGYKGGAKYPPRTYLSGKQFHGLCKWVKGIADELYPAQSVEAFDKIMGCASVLLDMSKYAEAKLAEPKKTTVRMATPEDVQTVKAGEDVYDIPEADVPF